MNNVLFDFAKKVGKMKPVNGVNSAPYQLMKGDNQVLIKETFTELHLPYSRTHDVCYPYGSGNYVDIPNIFRDFDADENDENNYDFHYTDEFLKPIIESGAQIIYRLGISIEWGTKKYRTQPPKDYAKWARICEHIIMHYNKGWANGFHYGIEYWEIWNEPENPPMWSGTREEFYDLYRVSAKYLKSKFSEIKIGGFASCGFYAVTSRKQSPFFLGCLDWYHDFLKMCTTENIPLDFFSWHLYTGDFNEFVEHAKYVRKTLDEAGLTKTESHFNEWNIGGENAGFHLMRNMIGASYVASVLAYMQNTNYVDAAMYYSFENTTAYNGLLDQNLFWKTCTYYAMKAFGDCYALKDQVYADATGTRLGVVGATDGTACSAYLSNYDAIDAEYNLTLKGINGKVILTVIEEKGSTDTEYSAEGELAIKINLPKNSVITIKATR